MEATRPAAYVEHCASERTAEIAKSGFWPRSNQLPSCALDLTQSIQPSRLSRIFRCALLGHFICICFVLSLQAYITAPATAHFPAPPECDHMMVRFRGGSGLPLVNTCEQATHKPSGGEHIVESTTALVSRRQGSLLPDMETGFCCWHHQAKPAKPGFQTTNTLLVAQPTLSADGDTASKGNSSPSSRVPVAFVDYERSESAQPTSRGNFVIAMCMSACSIETCFFFLPS